MMGSSYGRYLLESDAGSFWLIIFMALCKTTLVLSVIPWVWVLPYIGIMVFKSGLSDHPSSLPI